MSLTLSFTESDVFTQLRTLLMQMTPGIEVVLAQVNRVSEPAGADFVVMTPLLRTRLATNTDTYANDSAPAIGTRQITQTTQFDVQLDVHGPASGNNVQTIATLWRDLYSTTFFDACPIDIQSLYASDPRQVPFLNAESQYENRWTIDLSLQVNPSITLPQDFGDEVDISVHPGTDTGIVNVDVVYPP